MGKRLCSTVVDCMEEKRREILTQTFQFVVWVDRHIVVLDKAVECLPLDY